MKVLQINTVYPQGSTGKICAGIAKACEQEGMEAYLAYAHGAGKAGEREIIVSSWLDHHIHNRLARMTMGIGCFSYWHTRRFLRRVNKLPPDIIHLHNLHGNYIHLGSLFRWIKKQGVPVVWTLHDCWSFTGFCTYYTMAQCDRWKASCGSCPNRHQDPVTLLDCSRRMLKKKKKMFTGIGSMMLVTPSQWLRREVGQSFLKGYPTHVIPNGIDLTVFQPRKSAFRADHGIGEDNMMLLGVAFGWGERKGLDIWIELARRLDEQYRIVLVGTDDQVDRLLPPNILSIHRTHDQAELAEIYSAADLFVNPTREDNYPTVNLEALACGTPVVTFDTGGSAEMLDETCGSVVAPGDVDALEREILRITTERPYTIQDCLRRAASFDRDARFDEYVALYRAMSSAGT